MKYYVRKIKAKNEIESCEKFQINQYMWNSSREPVCYGWMGYLDNEGLYVRMVCEEQNPKREYKNHRDPVYKDSTMEVFLGFANEEGKITNDCMYTNFEMNSNGAMWASYGEGRENRQFITDEQYELTQVCATICEDKWYVEVLFPESYLNQICDFEAIKQGKPFYCNFYKIAESEEIVHFGSFSPIESETPNFHLPVCFAEAVIQ